ncbi:cobinamide phosphate guanylyltransferase [Sulfurovum sp. bin170]|uniref:bifunctional adenosylcobinamide kinase/adenosylcobinamide-phosphate guanylyltransferase n=1 Tax=Sulfurovum sp. bin170 TaxID=2695268 RepID=UPI0013DF0D18|nr:bifunctional adenosylcobinamide kinase/adenosylcobinamide-phosphate guanylyltransferase [Sulfurovum sp. bin170]NEW60153.1 cobinamide phosphate guanylyltransferase [Sulfurovum sp. bin170]
MSKILYYGGQKSGKSLLAEQKALKLSHNKQPYYIATYDNSYADQEMQERIDRHKLQRENKFISIEEPFDLPLVINNEGTYLIDCLSMWILNTLDMKIEKLFEQLETLAKKDTNTVFVLNDVSSGIIPIDAESRKFVDRSGTVGQRVAKICDEVYEVKLGLEIRLK